MILVLIPSNGGREVNGAQNYVLLWWRGVDDWSSPYFLTGNFTTDTSNSLQTFCIIPYFFAAHFVETPPYLPQGKKFL